MAEVIAIPGNLIPVNTFTFHPAYMSAWSGTGGTLTYANGTVTPFGGGTLGRMQSSGTAASVLSMTNPAPVTAGTRYTAWAWIAVPARATTVTMEIDWLNASSTLISTSSQAWSIPNTTVTVRRPSVSGVAPVGATQARMRVRNTNTASGQLVYYDFAYFGTVSARAIPGSLLTYDETYPGDTGTDALWTATGGTITRDESVYISTFDYALTGTTMLRLTPGSSANFTTYLNRTPAVTPGTTYRWGPRVAIKQGGNPNLKVHFRPLVEWLDASNAVVSTAHGPWSISNIVGEYISLQRTVTPLCPPGATKVRVGIEIDPSVDFPVPYYLLDSPVLAVNTASYELTVYDQDGYVQLDVLPDPNLPYADRLTIWRVHPDGEQIPVRTFDGDSVGLIYDRDRVYTVEDYEVPPGTRVWYRVIRYDSAAPLTRTETYTAPIQSPQWADDGLIWIKSPGTPALSLQVTMESPIEWTRAARVGEYSVVGRTNPVTVSGVRSGRTGTASVLVWDQARSDALAGLLSSGTSCLINALPGLGIEGNLYVSVRDAVESPVSGRADEPTRRWTLALVESDRPKGPLQGTRGRTWDTVEDFSDWSAIYDRYATWADVLTNTLIGT